MATALYLPPLLPHLLLIVVIFIKNVAEVPPNVSRAIPFAKDF
ncbi:MAG: hypothetical protein Q6367_009475 [Candidatus Freyarchaeota archaeon]